MNRLRHFFLHANRWQMCLLFFVVCVVAQFLGPIAIISAAPSSAAIARSQVLGVVLLAAVSGVVFLSWLWFIGSFLRSVVRPSLRPRVSFFRVAIIYPLLFIFVESALLITTGSWPFALIVPTSIFAFFCLLYDFNFVAKTLFMAETGEPPTMGDNWLTFLQLWFFPVGAWFIQPRVNRLYKRGARDLSAN